LWFDLGAASLLVWRVKVTTSSRSVNGLFKCLAEPVAFNVASNAAHCATVDGARFAAAVTAKAATTTAASMTLQHGSKNQYTSAKQSVSQSVNSGKTNILIRVCKIARTAKDG
jgi:hypothetical protein